MNYRRTTKMNRIGIWLLAILPWFLFGAASQSESLTFRFEADPGGSVDSELLVFRPDALSDEHFFLYIESTDTLDGGWTVDALPHSSVDEHGFVVVQGTSDMKFWRLRIMPALRADENWPTRLTAVRTEEYVRLTLSVKTDYFPAVRDYVHGASEVAVPWEHVPEGMEERIDELTGSAIERLLEIVTTTQPRKGDEFQVLRFIEDE